MKAPIFIPVEPSWSQFYEKLLELGPEFISGLDRTYIAELFKLLGADDHFWSPALELELTSNWEFPEMAVRMVCNELAENVKGAIREQVGIFGFGFVPEIKVERHEDLELLLSEVHANQECVDVDALMVAAGVRPGGPKLPPPKTFLS